jgi:aminomethyltransferase
MTRATPFHIRTAEFNRDNAWAQRCRFTLPEHFGDPSAEAMAARFAVTVSDISWRWRLRLEGTRVLDLAQRLFTRDPSSLVPGAALKALWLSDGGGLRGAGLAARLDKQALQLVSACEDHVWIAGAAGIFGVEIHDMTEEEGGLALIGPYAARLFATLGFDPALEPLAFRRVDWRGLDVTVSRFGEHSGYEIWCKADDAPLVWDRVMRAGAPFALRPIGLDAMDILDLEAGIPRPGRDYDGAIATDASGPHPAELRLATLIDADHLAYNGRQGLIAAKPKRRLVGLAFDGETPAPFAAIHAGSIEIGRTLSSCWSPALRRAIALAQIDEDKAHAGTAVSLAIPATRERLLPTMAAARIVDLPFLAPPDPIET